MQSQSPAHKIEESILSKAGVGIGIKTKQVVDDVITASTEFPMLWFLEGNNLRLDSDTVKKITTKLKKALPEGAFFNTRDGIRQIAKQDVEKYGSVNYPDIKYAYYNIEITYGVKRGSRFSTRTEMREFIIRLTYDHIYALDIPETKSMLDELDTYFAKYTTQDEVKLSPTYTIWSEIGGKYRIYSFKDLKKEFVATKQ